ncbi:MAG: hypothetical protein ACYSTX_01350 [Planctomycetota bacterium]|jgi:hypothetical protein
MNKNTMIVFLIVFLIIGTLVTFNVERSNAQARSSSEAPWGNVTFSNQLYNLIFFDHETGHVYLYSDDGKIQEIWTINQLGKNLVKKYDAREPGVTR